MLYLLQYDCLFSLLFILISTHDCRGEGCATNVAGVKCRGSLYQNVCVSLELPIFSYCTSITVVQVLWCLFSNCAGGGAYICQCREPPPSFFSLCFRWLCTVEPDCSELACKLRIIFCVRLSSEPKVTFNEFKSFCTLSAIIGLLPFTL